MAKSKSGGTRSLLRGRVGSDVYSIGRNAKGQRQQVVRSLAEQVANPQTAAQMKGRAIMSTVMQAVAAMAGIIDHSFNGVVAGQPSISEFIRVNYALIKADVNAHPASSNVFGINKYQEKGIKQGAYQISKGEAAGLSGITFDGSAKTLTIAVGATLNPAKVREALNIAVNDFFTVCCINATGAFLFSRVHVSTALSDDTTITSSNIASVFEFDGNVAVTPSVSSNNIVLTFADASANYGIIVSRKVDAGFKYNTVVLAAPSAPASTFDVAIATYPEGSRRFLNGGDTALVDGGGSSSGGSGGGGEVIPGGGGGEQIPGAG